MVKVHIPIKSKVRVPINYLVILYTYIRHLKFKDSNERFIKSSLKPKRNIWSLVNRWWQLWTQKHDLNFLVQCCNTSKMLIWNYSHISLLNRMKRKLRYLFLEIWTNLASLPENCSRQQACRIIILDFLSFRPKQINIFVNMLVYYWPYCYIIIYIFWKWMWLIWVDLMNISRKALSLTLKFYYTLIICILVF